MKKILFLIAFIAIVFSANAQTMEFTLGKPTFIGSILTKDSPKFKEGDIKRLSLDVQKAHIITTSGIAQTYKMMGTKTTDNSYIFKLADDVLIFVNIEGGEITTIMVVDEYKTSWLYPILKLTVIPNE